MRKTPPERSPLAGVAEWLAWLVPALRAAADDTARLRRLSQRSRATWGRHWDEPARPASAKPLSHGFARADTIGMSVTPSQFELLGGLLDTAALRHQVIAHNVANVNTPGYRRLEVEFESTLRQHLEAGNTPGARPPEPHVIEGPSWGEREDGNNVDIDMEIGQLNKNTTLYNVYSQILATRISTMRSAITGR